MLIHLQL